MIANSTKEFYNNVGSGIIDALNTEAGQEITNKLLAEKLKENPSMTTEEWTRTKQELVAFIFCEYMKNTPQAMQELATHTYNELRATD